MNWRRTASAVVGSLAALGVATALVYALRPVAPVLSLGVLYTLGVLAVSVLYGLPTAVVTAVASMLAFNFLFLPPLHTFRLAEGENWAALAVYLATAVVASQLAAQARRRAAEAERREQEAALLADAAAALLQEQSLDEVAARAERVLASADTISRGRFDAAMDSLAEVARERAEADVVRRSDAIKTAILQTVSHDFRTPIATISAAVGGLEHQSLTLSRADRAELLETIRLETARLARLVENVLDLSRLQTGTAAPHRALWSVDELAGGAVADASTPSRVTLDLPDGLPPVLVDAMQMQRALVNLLENALRFSEGAVELRARSEGGSVVLDVLDEGGVRAAAGLGLGLEIARGFARVNDAQLEVTPRAGGGTRARLVLRAVTRAAVGS